MDIAAAHRPGTWAIHITDPCRCTGAVGGAPRQVRYYRLMDGLFDRLLDLHSAHPELRLELLLRLVLAALLGGAIGWERQYSRKPAGLRTNVLICVGAALLTDTSMRMAAMGSPPTDPGRIAAQIVTGVGFLGAGTIIQSRGIVTGLTTAATLWVVAAIGMVVGSGGYVEGAGATALVLIVLVPLRAVERWTARRSPLPEGSEAVEVELERPWAGATGASSPESPDPGSSGTPPRRSRSSE